MSHLLKHAIGIVYPGDHLYWFFFQIGVEGVAFSEPWTPACRTGSGLAGAVHRQPITEPVSTGKPYSLHSSGDCHKFSLLSFICYSTKVFTWT